MKTEFEILAESLDIHPEPLKQEDAYIEGSVEGFVKAMQEYAKQEAIEFGEWLRDYIQVPDGLRSDMELYELYKIWKDENNK